MMVAIGNFLFRYRNMLFPPAYALWLTAWVLKKTHLLVAD